MRLNDGLRSKTIKKASGHEIRQRIPCSREQLIHLAYHDIRHSFRAHASLIGYGHVRALQKRVSTRNGDKSRTLHTSQLRPTAGAFSRSREKIDSRARGTRRVATRRAAPRARTRSVARRMGISSRLLSFGLSIRQQRVRVRVAFVSRQRSAER